MQNCWRFASWSWINARLVAWPFIISWVAAYVVPKLAMDSPYDAPVALSPIAIMP